MGMRRSIEACSVSITFSKRCPQSFLELLAGPAANDFDLDIYAYLGPGQSDHPFGQIDDPNRLAHLQHEDLATLGHERRLEY